jgi:hypothetical protein
MQSTVWGDSHMLPCRGVRAWVVYLTPKIERVIRLLSASPVGEARCRCRKVWLTRIDYYYYYYSLHGDMLPGVHIDTLCRVDLYVIAYRMQQMQHSRC